MALCIGSFISTISRRTVTKEQTLSKIDFYTIKDDRLSGYLFILALFISYMMKWTIGPITMYCKLNFRSDKALIERDLKFSMPTLPHFFVHELRYIHGYNYI